MLKTHDTKYVIHTDMHTRELSPIQPDINKQIVVRRIGNINREIVKVIEKVDTISKVITKNPKFQDKFRKRVNKCHNLLY
jgi:hypothetical protein